MAARRSNPKRRRTVRRRARRRNPVYRVAAAPRRANRRYSRRRRNPGRRRRFTTHRRNPAITGLLVKGLWVGGGVFVTDILQGLIPIQVSSPLMRIGIRVGTAWALGAFAGRFVGQANAELLALGGLAGAGQDAIRLLWSGAGGVFGPMFQPQQQQLPAGGAPVMLDSGDGQGVGMITYVPQGYEARG